LTSLCGKVADEVAGFNPPAASYFNAEDQEAAPAACRQELGVSTAFAGDCGGYSAPWFRRGAWVREPGSADGADTRRVDGQLLTVVRLQSIGHDFNSASIGDRAGNVHVCHGNIASYSASRFAADPGHGGFQRRGSRRQRAGCGARGPVVAILVKVIATATPPWCDGQWHPEAAQQGHTEVLVWEF